MRDLNRNSSHKVFPRVPRNCDQISPQAVYIFFLTWFGWSAEFNPKVTAICVVPLKMKRKWNVMQSQAIIMRKKAYANDLYRQDGTRNNRDDSQYINIYTVRRSQKWIRGHRKWSQSRPKQKAFTENLLKFSPSRYSEKTVFDRLFTLRSH